MNQDEREVFDFILESGIIIFCFLYLVWIAPFLLEYI